jgi:Uma2 family endonuclease
VRLCEGVMAQEITEELNYEIIYGEKIYMAQPKRYHISLANIIWSIFAYYIKQNILQDEVYSEYTLDCGEMGELVPDVMLIKDIDNAKVDKFYGVPSLVAEVLSPSTSKKDLGVKREIYAKIGVPEYWIVEPLSKTVTVYKQENGDLKIEEVYSLIDEACKTKFYTIAYGDKLEIDLEEMFKRVRLD